MFPLRCLFKFGPFGVPIDIRNLNQKILNSYLFLEPFHCIIFGDSMAESNSTLASSPFANSVSLPSEDNVEIHSIDTNAWIIFDSEIDVFLDSKPKVTSGREVSFLQFIFSDLE